MGSSRSPRGFGFGDRGSSSELGRPSPLELGLGIAARRFARRSDKPDGVVVWYCWVRFELAISRNTDLKEEELSPGEDWYCDIAGGILGV